MASRTGAPLPRLLYGTAWKEERTEALTRLALEVGYVGIDTANQRKHYVEVGVGAAVRSAISAGIATRERLFLQTKFTFAAGQDSRLPYDPRAPIPAQVEQSFRSSLEHLGTDYLDSYVLHGPSQGRGLGRADWDAWRAMEELLESGRARYLGVSNVSLEQLRALTDGARQRPAFVQNRCYARQGWDRDVRSFCRAHGMVYQGFSLLTANARELARPVVKAIAARAGRTVPEVVFAFALAAGMLPLTGSSNAEHLRQDFSATTLELLPDEVNALERLSA